MASEGLSAQDKSIDERLRGKSPRDKTNVDLLKERDGASFDPMSLTHVLDDGPQKTYRRRYIGQYKTNSLKAPAANQNILTNNNK